MTATSNPRVRAGSSVGSYRPVASASCDVATRHVLDVRFPGGQSLDPYHVDVEADDVESDLDRPHGDGKPRVALTDDDQAIRLWRRPLGARRFRSEVG